MNREYYSDLYSRLGQYEYAEALLLCDVFAVEHELTNDYVYAEFANPEVDSLKAVTESLDPSTWLVYSSITGAEEP